MIGNAWRRVTSSLSLVSISKVVTRTARSYGSPKHKQAGKKANQLHFNHKFSQRGSSNSSRVSERDVLEAQKTLASSIFKHRTPLERLRLFGKTAVIGSGLIVGFETLGTYVDVKMDHNILYFIERASRFLHAERMGDSFITPKEYPMLGCIAVFGAVFLAFRFQPFIPFLLRNFTYTPASGRILTWFTAPLSHAGFVHLAFNSIAFFSIGKIVYAQTYPGEFGAFCGIAAICSSLGTLLHYAITGISRPGLGASGVVMGLFGMTAFLEPDARFQLIFFPFVDFSPKEILYGLCIFDMVGLLLGWSALGHAAHLGGLAAGVAYYHWRDANYPSFRAHVARLFSQQYVTQDTQIFPSPFL